MELYTIHIICSIRESKPYILTDKQRGEALQTYACADKAQPYSLLDFVEKDEMIEQENPNSAIGRDVTNLPLSKLQDQKRVSTLPNLQDSRETLRKGALNEGSETSINMPRKEKLEEIEEGGMILEVQKRTEVHTTCNSSTASFKEKSAVNQNTLPICVREEACLSQLHTDSIPEARWAGLKSDTVLTQHGSRQEKDNFEFCREVQNWALNSSIETESGKIHGLNQPSHACSSHEVKKAARLQKKAKTKSIFHHFFAFDDNFQPFSFVFGENSPSNSGMTASKPMHKCGNKPESEKEGIWSGSVCPERLRKEVTCDSPLSLVEFSMENEADKRDLGNDTRALQARRVTGDDIVVTICHCSSLTRNKHMRRHSIGSAHFSGDSCDQTLTGTHHESQHYSPIMSRHTKNVNKTEPGSLDESQWQSDIDNHFDFAHSKQFKGRRASADSVKSIKDPNFVCLPSDGHSDKMKRASKESRLSLLGSRLFRAMGFKKEGAEESDRSIYKVRQTKSKSSDSISKHCSRCKGKRLLWDMSDIGGNSSLQCKDTVSSGFGRTLVTIGNNGQRNVDCGGDSTQNYDCCDKMVCIDLPLTNFGFYSGEMMIFM